MYKNAWNNAKDEMLLKYVTHENKFNNHFGIKLHNLEYENSYILEDSK